MARWARRRYRLRYSRWSDPGWVGAVINFLLSPPPWITFPLLIVGAALIGWDYYRHKNAALPLAVTPVPASNNYFADLLTARVKDRKREDDHDLIPGKFRLHASWSRDGADITAFVRVRNRSLINLRIEVENGWSFEVDGRSPPGRDISLNDALAPSTEQTVAFPLVRILKAAPGVKGHAEMAIRFGPPKGLTEVLHLRFDFTLVEELKPDTKGRVGINCTETRMVRYSKVT